MGIFGSGGLPDPLNVHKDKSKGGMGLPDPFGLFDSMPALAAAGVAALAPPPSLITPTPIATDTDKQVAKRKMLTDQQSRKGRSSTILTDTLGAS